MKFGKHSMDSQWRGFRIPSQTGSHPQDSIDSGLYKINIIDDDEFV